MLRNIHTRKALGEASRLLEQKLKAQMKIDKTYASGRISKSIKAISDSNTASILADFEIKYVDKGASPSGVVPYRAIIEWAKAKGVRPKAKDGKRISFNRMAWIIAKSISENGTIKRFKTRGGGSGLIDFVLSNNAPKIRNSVREAYQQDLHNHIQQNVIKK